MLVIEIGQPHHLETNPFGLRPSAERSDRRLGARSFLQIGPPLARPQTFIEEAHFPNGIRSMTYASQLSASNVSYVFTAYAHVPWLTSPFKFPAGVQHGSTVISLR